MSHSHELQSGSDGSTPWLIILVVLCGLLLVLVSFIAWQQMRAEALGSAKQVSTPSAARRHLPPTARSGSRGEETSESSKFWMGSEPPPIWPQMILPKHEARFVVPLAQLTMAWQQPVDVLMPKGTKALHVEFREMPDSSRYLAISKADRPDEPQITVVSPRPKGPNPSIEQLRILEVNSVPQKQQYGLLQLDDSGAGLFYKGSLVMSLDWQMQDEETLLIATSPDGTYLALGGWMLQTGSSSEGIDHFSLKVKPAVDAVLVLACMLAKLVLDTPTPEGQPQV